ncbi:regulatory protein RecX [Cohnella kolymensis]|uniref:regulatory protein RecX n=1 Tax=Cohnella kolymensis TaxID=1590652 RepID=UPI000695CAF7|nr:regulatory protein RecX [Cohnella kolymensis]
MYKSRRTGKGYGWTGSRQKKSANAPSGLAGELEGSPNTSDVPSGLAAELEDLPITGATIVAVEAHPKQSHMYRLALKLEVGEAPPDVEGAHDDTEHDQAGRDWPSEVDALIASAQLAGPEAETLLTVHEDTLVSWRLLKGRRLSAEEYAELKEDEQKEEAYRTSLGMLERKARTTAELSKSLKRKGFSPEVITGCLERLQQRGMLDDSAFAKRFTEQRAVSQRKGRLLIRQELLQRGVRREEIDAALGELDGELEQNSALVLARKRWPNIKGNDRERKQKLMAMLMRRGFPGSIVKTAVQQIAAESADEEAWFEFDPDVGTDPDDSLD